ncbi:efflux RND transporter periplasmic adaptor subunit [Maioricimonas rarisocia]|uniref:efflux RND transporter periplasmic adaptor subunit n=1 Tax=Maioricimonas rarisocia TaxID=2528026 RepID=UPI0018D209A9|nr:efflux RND transporter periplasmic adaptor subunit [Maioricimonas rarisocia]
MLEEQFVAGVSRIDRPAAAVPESVRRIRSVAISGDVGAVRRALFDELVSLLDAVGGAAWTIGPQREVQLVMQYGLGPERIDAVHDRWPGHRELLLQALTDATPQFASAAFESDATGSGTGPRQFRLLLFPWPVKGQPTELLELFIPPESLASEDDALEVVRQLCEAAVPADAPPQPTGRAESPTQLAAYIQAVHSSLDIERVALTATNEGRLLLGCDRLSIAVGRGRSLRMTAISGLTSFDRRSPAIRALESLGRTVQNDATPCFHTGTVSDAPESLRGPLTACVEEISPQVLYVLPLADGDDEASSPVGVLVAEHFDNEINADLLRQSCQEIAPVIGTAISNAADYEGLIRIPLLGRLLRSRSRRFGRPGISRRVFAVLLIAALAALVLVPADLEISGRAELQPRDRRPVYAGSTGVIEELMVDHAEAVEAGEPLIRLRNRELDFEISRVDGELQTVLQQIADAQALRARPVRSSTSPPASADEMAAREQELKQVRDSLIAQLEILRQQEQDLTLTSPLAGQVLTWNVQEQLESRPVEIGQRLLTVADVNGPWVVEMHVRDRDIGHVREARAAIRPDLEVEIVLPGDPPVRHLGTVRSVTETVEYDELDGPTVLVTVDVDAERINAPKPGTTVAARIQCGREPLGYVLFRQVIDAVRTWWAF